MVELAILKQIADMASHAGQEAMNAAFRICDTLNYDKKLQLMTLAMSLAVIQDMLTTQREIIRNMDPELDGLIQDAINVFVVKRVQNAH